MKALGLEVLEPGLVRVEGIWATHEHAVVITHSSLSFMWPGLLRPVSIMGDGSDSILNWQGPITESMFRFSDSGPTPTTYVWTNPDDIYRRSPFLRRDKATWRSNGMVKSWIFCKSRRRVSPSWIVSCNCSC